MHTRKAELVPASSFSEPSEPSQIRPEDAPADTLRGPQEENPQLVAHSKGRQSADRKDVNTAGRGRRGKESDHRDEARRANEEKRKDVAGGFGVGRAKL